VSLRDTLSKVKSQRSGAPALAFCLQDRPNTTFSELSWSYHFCRLYEVLISADDMPRPQGRTDLHNKMNVHT
jgi:hypothetical protein